MANERKTANSRIVEKTGKSWEEWFVFFDRFDNDRLNHKELVQLLKDNFSLSPWYMQMIVVTYEKERKGRNNYQYSDGYRISVTKQVETSLSTMSNLWTDEKLRNNWFPVSSYTLVRETPRKFIRLLWSDTLSVVEISFSAINSNHCRINIEHRRLPSRESAEEMRVYWKRVLERLNEMVSTDQFHCVIQD
jgi:hypothetical protein